MIESRARTFIPTTLVFLLLCSAVALGPAAGGEPAAKAAFEQLKALAGTWTGEAAAGEGKQGMAVTHEFRVSANGTVVMETMNPGTDYEMINMYHMNGDDLVLTHYCAGGNQPTMKLEADAARPDELRFEFTGGTNLDPAKDTHIHAARILLDDGKIESNWTAYSEGKEAGVTTFNLTREKR